jgi:ABC-type branched-subunit amino acid transport system substrate-binding protein
MTLPLAFKKERVVVWAASTIAVFRSTLGAGLLFGPLGCANLLDIEADPQLVAQSPSTSSCQGTIRVKLTTDTDTDASGSARDIAPSYNQGIIDYIDELNDSAGRIRGCPVELQVGEGDHSAVVTEQVIGGWRVVPTWREVSTLFVFGTSSVKRVAADLAFDGKLVIAGASSGSLASPAPISRDVVHPLVGADGTESSRTENVRTVGYPNVFFVGMDDSTIARGLLAEISNRGGGRVALVADDECAFCEDPLAAIRQQIGGQARLELGRDVKGVKQGVGNSDQARVQGILDEYFQWEINTKLADPDYEPVSWLWLGNGIIATNLVGRAVAKVQANIDASLPEGDRWTVRLAANPWGFSEETPELCGEPCHGVLIGVTPVYGWGETERSAGMSDLMAVHSNARSKAGQDPSLFRNHHYVRGYAAAMMWHRGVEQALENGNSSPTGDDIKDALDALRDEGLEGLTAGPLNLAPDDHRSQTRYNVYTIDAAGDLVFDGQGSIQPSNLWLGY